MLHQASQHTSSLPTHQNLHGNTPDIDMLTLSQYLSEPELPVLVSLRTVLSVTPPYRKEQRELPCWAPIWVCKAGSEKGRLCCLDVLLLQVSSQFYASSLFKQQSYSLSKTQNTAAPDKKCFCRILLPFLFYSSYQTAESKMCLS